MPYFDYDHHRDRDDHCFHFGNEAKKAMISGGHEEAYHKLAEQAVEAQQKYADEQQKISEGIDDLRNRVAAIERILREVD
jgi:hypothetical protein